MVPRNEVARRFAGFSFTWSLALLLGGCGPNIPANPSTQPVHGTVTYKSEPFSHGYIVFTPAPGSTQGIAAEGALRDDGTYDARAFVGQSGTTPGEYIVWFSPLAQGARGESMAESLPIPQKYQSAETSDLKQTITDGENTIDIDIPEAEGDAAEEE